MASVLKISAMCSLSHSISLRTLYPNSSSSCSTKSPACSLSFCTHCAEPTFAAFARAAAMLCGCCRDRHSRRVNNSSRAGGGCWSRRFQSINPRFTCSRKRSQGHKCRFRSRWWCVAVVEFDCLDSKSYPKHSAARDDGKTTGPARFNGRSHDMTLLASNDSITFTFTFTFNTEDHVSYALRI